MHLCQEQREISYVLLSSSVYCEFGARQEWLKQSEIC